MSTNTEFEKAMRGLEAANQELEDASSRYLKLGGGTYIRLTYALTYNGRHEEAEALDTAMRRLDREGIKYMPPKHPNALSDEGLPASSIPAELTDESLDFDVEVAIRALEYYGFEIKKPVLTV